MVGGAGSGAQELTNQNILDSALKRQTLKWCDGGWKEVLQQREDTMNKITNLEMSIKWDVSQLVTHI